MSDSNMLSVLFSGDQSYVYQHEIIVSVFAVFVLGTHSVAGGTCSLQAVYMQSTGSLHAVYMECPGTEHELSHLGNETRKPQW